MLHEQPNLGCLPPPTKPVEVSPGAGSFESDADDAHIAVIHQALAARQPLLGICRGHQLLNVALGGNLVQHMPTTENHRGAGAGENHYQPTWLSLDTEALAGDVNISEPVLCTHHQALHVLGEGLEVVARAADGEIEAVAHRSAPLTGVQWHPEHPAVAQAQLVPLLRRLQRQYQGAV